jgi:Na+/melibiose symporter-like transporter
VGVGLTLIGYEEHVTPSADVVFGLELLFAVPTTFLVLVALWIFRAYDAAEPRASHRVVSVGA